MAFLSLGNAAYLREKAAQFRRLAAECEPIVAGKMLEVSIELEAKAAEIAADPNGATTRH